MFWRLLTMARTLRFRVGRLGFRGVLFKRRRAEDASAFGRIVGSAALPVIGALVIFASLWALSRWRFSILAWLHLDSGWVEREAHRSVNPSAYDSMLQALAGVGGVFLALYFASVNTVAATVYARVPRSIRNLLLRDRESNVYVRIVALLTALAALLALARAGGATVWLPALPVLAFLSLLAVYAFVRLGQQMFYFFDPSGLTRPLEEDFTLWAGRAKAGRYRAEDPSFQAHYRVQGKRSINSLAALGRIAISDDLLDSGPAHQVAAAATRTLVSYLSTKTGIPSKSLWFGQRARHKQWFLTSMTEVQIAGMTMTSLQPELVPDRDWVEESITDTLTTIIRAHVEQRRFAQAGELIASAANVVSALAHAGQVALAMRWVEDMTRHAVEAALASPPASQQEQRDIVGVLDLCGMLWGSVCIGILHQERQFEIQQLEELLRNAKTIRDVVLQRPLHPAVKEYVESVADTLEFEAAADAPVRTALWYVSETTLNTFALSLEEDTRAYIGWVMKIARETIDQARAATRPAEAAALASRGLELAWRLAGLIDDTEQLANEITAAARMGDDLVRPRWEFDRQRRRAAAFQVAVVQRLAEQIPALALIEPREDIPDYLGEAVHRAGEACFDALATNDSAAFAGLFSPYFFGTRTVFDRIRVQLNRQHPVAALPWLIEPIIDALTISGLALVYAELHEQPELWHPVRDEWEQALAGANGNQFMQLVAMLIASRESRLGLGPRDLVRTWNHRTERTINELPTTGPTASGPWGPSSYSRTVVHPSALIRELGEHGGLRGNTIGLDVFVARFLMKHPLGSGLDFGIPSHRISDIEQLPTLRSET